MECRIHLNIYSEPPRFSLYPLTHLITGKSPIPFMLVSLHSG